MRRLMGVLALVGVVSLAPNAGAAGGRQPLPGAAFMWPTASGDPFKGFVGPWRVNHPENGETAGISIRYAVLCYTPNQTPGNDFVANTTVVVSEPVTLVKIRDAAQAAGIAVCGEFGITVAGTNVLMPAVTTGV